MRNKYLADRRIQFFAAIFIILLAGFSVSTALTTVQNLPSSITGSVSWYDSSSNEISNFETATVSGTISAGVVLSGTQWSIDGYLYTVNGMTVYVYKQLSDGSYSEAPSYTFSSKETSGTEYVVQIDTTTIENGEYRFDVASESSKTIIPLSVSIQITSSGMVPAVTVVFTTSISGGVSPYTFLWDFGDDSATVTTQNPSHVYTAAGSYSAKVEVTDSEDTVEESTIGITIEAPPATPLHAVVLAVPVSGVSPLQVTFSTTVTGGKSPYTYSWNFGDQSASSTLQNPTHWYASAGSYMATVTVTDGDSNHVGATAGVVVTAPTPTLGISISANPSSGNYPLAVGFAAIVSGGKAPYTYWWNFGDGSTGSGATISHTYTTAGSFMVALTVSDSDSPISSKQTNVVITTTTPPAPEGLTVSISKTKVAYDANSITYQWSPSVTGGSGTYTSYFWTLETGSTSTQQSPTHKYYEGTYTITCLVTDSAGHTAQGSATIYLKFTNGPNSVFASAYASFTTISNVMEFPQEDYSLMAFGVIAVVGLGLGYFYLKQRSGGKRSHGNNR